MSADDIHPRFSGLGHPPGPPPVRMPPRGWPGAGEEFERAFAYLKQRTNYELGAAGPRWTPHLASIRELAAALGHPERSYPTLHIAGTKGKGSTAHFLAALLQRAGRRVGLYTSPHLDHPLERIRIQGKPLDPGRFAAIIADFARLLPELSRGAEASFFDLMTMAAMEAFRRTGVEIGVFEVGLGGRLDSTNIIQPEVCVITSISFDHTRILGRSLECIAQEKAGIIKSPAPVVCGLESAHPARPVIAARAAAQGAPLFSFGTEFTIAGAQALGAADELEVRLWNGRRVALSPPVRAPFQARNLSLAVAALEALAEGGLLENPAQAYRGQPIDLYVPGRFELIPGESEILLDGAHNREALLALAAALRLSFPGRRAIAVIATARDKLTPGLFAPLRGLVLEALATRTENNPRSARPADLAAALRSDGIPARAMEKAEQALEKAREICREEKAGYLLVTGSLYLVGQIRRSLNTA